jgi:hypothetical protein
LELWFEAKNGFNVCVCVCVCLFVGSYSFEQEKDLAKHCSLLEGVGNFGLKQDHNAT